MIKDTNEQTVLVDKPLRGEEAASTPPLAEGPDEARHSIPVPSQKGTGGFVVRFIRRSAPLVVVAAGAVVVLALAKFLPKRDTGMPPTPPEPVSVKVVVVQPLPEVEDSFRIPGVVEPNCIVDVAAEVAAQVDAYAGLKDTLDKDDQPIKGPSSAGVLDEGVSVRAGQPIVYLNTDLLRAQRDRAKAEFDFQEREIARIEELFKRNVATKTEVDRVMMQRDVAKAALDLAEANLRRATILAPIRGVLNRLPEEIGEYVAPGTPVAQIVDVDQVKIVVDVPERDIGYLALGAEQTVLCGIDHPQEVKGKITYISELADADTRTTRVEITVDNPPGPDGRRTLRSGQIVQAQLLRRKLHDVILVPLEAVVPLEKGYTAYVVHNGLAEKRSVELDSSLIKGQSIRVSSGLKPGDRLIVSRDNRIGPDQPVRVISVDGQPVSASQPTSSETGP